MDPNHSLKNSFIIKRGKLDDLIHQYPVSTKEYSALLICTKGNIQIGINQEEILIEKNQLIGLKPYTELTSFQISDDCEGLAFGIHRNLFQHFTEPILHFEPIHILRLNTFAKIVLTDQQLENLEDIFRLLEKQASSKDSFFKFQKVKSLFTMMTYEIIQIMTEDKQVNTSDFTRSKIITSNFFILLNTNVHQKKGVEYFADKLNITSKHLIASVKSTTQETPRKIIDRMLLTHAQNMLSNKAYSIQMIAESLGFSDASAFTKFFKRNAGCTPKEFRQENN